MAARTRSTRGAKNARTRSTRGVKKKRTSRPKTKGPLERLEDGLPQTLKDYSRRLRRGLGRLERDLVQRELSARRKAARLLREASHQLGQLEARGEREFRRRATRARREADRLLHRVERAIDPSPPPRKKTAATRKKKVSRKTRSTGARRAARGEASGSGI